MDREKIERELGKLSYQVTLQVEVCRKEQAKLQRLQGKGAELCAELTECKEESKETQ